MSAKDVAQQFANHYYTTFDSNRAALAPLYQNSSTMTWEGTDLAGQAAIMEKFASLPGMKHQVSTVDTQPISAQALIVYVTGKLSVSIYLYNENSI